MRQKARLFLQLVAVVVLLLGGTCAEGGSIVLTDDTLSNLLGGNITKVAGPLTVDMSAANMASDVCSSAYAGDNGLYAYLYQVINKGTVGNSSIDTFTVFPVWGAGDGSRFGTLTNLVGTDGEFRIGGLSPLAEGFIEDPGTGPVVSYYYSKDQGADIPAGQHSKVLYLISDQGPATITGNVIDGATGTGPVYGPVPEPGTALSLLLGLAGLAWFRGYRIR